MDLFRESGLPNLVDRRLTVFGSDDRVRHPPRLLVRTLLITFATVGLILLAVFVVLLLDLRSRVNSEVADNLEAGRMVLAELEQRRLADLEVRLDALSRNPTLEAAIQKYQNRFGGFTQPEIRQSMVWLEGELQALAMAAGADVAAVVDRRSQTMARAGRLASDWPPSVSLARPQDAARTQDDALVVGSGLYRVSSLPLHVNGERVGTMCFARRLDARFASSVSTLTRAHTVIFGSRVMEASTLSAPLARVLAARWRAPFDARGHVSAGGETFAYRRLEGFNDAAVYGLASVTTPISRTTNKAFRALALVGVGALALAMLGSLFLARTVAGPIDAISRSLSAAVTSKDPGMRLESDGSSLEIEVLTKSFNGLMASLSRAENERRTAYLEAIQALAKALEARDRYTAGHSERVRDLSVRIARRMGMPAEQLEVLQLGASLHDIGKIGVGDGLLRKAGELTEAERRAIQAHPVLGARILEPVAFLAEHLSIVELHHEQPDGRGYPYGLTGERIPLPARIVHLADAFDAMTSDRPYRPCCSPSEAALEIIRHRGTQFDEAVVKAFLGVIGAEEQDRDEGATGSDAHSSLPHAGGGYRLMV